MDLRLLRTFVEVAECGSVSDAARRCGYSQPAVSHQLGALERHLTRRLFVRSATGMRLTDEGAALYPYARVVVRLVEELCAGVAASPVALDIRGSNDVSTAARRAG